MLKKALLLTFACVLFAYEPIKYQKDDACEIAINKPVKESVLKVYMPSIAYSHIMKIINGSLVRLSDDKKGWEYFLAKKYEKKDDLTYDFYLRKNVRFQNGKPFDAKNVIENFKYFIKSPFTYTDIQNRLKSVEMLGRYKIRIHLKKPYGMLLNDLARINFYTHEYLQKYGTQEQTLHQI